MMQVARKTNVVIIGASGHGSVILDIVMKSGDNVLGFIDDGKSGLYCGVPILGGVEEIQNYKNEAKFIVGIGDNKIRKSISERLEVSWYTAIHPSAEIAFNVQINHGSVVMANAVINSNTRIGKHCIVNTAAIVEHDSHIEDYVHISPNATICGTVHVAGCTHIGASSTVKNNLKICSNSIIGVGAVVVKNIDDPGVFTGVPAKKMISNKKMV